MVGSFVRFLFTQSLEDSLVRLRFFTTREEKSYALTNHEVIYITYTLFFSINTRCRTPFRIEFSLLIIYRALFSISISIFVSIYFSINHTKDKQKNNNNAIHYKFIIT